MNSFQISTTRILLTLLPILISNASSAAFSGLPVANITIIQNKKMAFGASISSFTGRIKRIVRKKSKICLRIVIKSTVKIKNVNFLKNFLLFSIFV